MGAGGAGARHRDERRRRRKLHYQHAAGSERAVWVLPQSAVPRDTGQVFFPSISLLTNSAWFTLVGSSLQVLNYNLLVIRAEEALLKAKFGEDWDAYGEQVRRWCPWC